MRRTLLLLILFTSTGLFADNTASFEAIGIWQVVNGDAEAEFITIGPQGAAIHSTRGIPDSNGTWHKENDSVMIYWQNGRTDVISQDQEDVVRQSYPPGEEPDGTPTSTSKMQRLQPEQPQPKAASWGASIILENC